MGDTTHHSSGWQLFAAFAIACLIALGAWPQLGASSHTRNVIILLGCLAVCIWLVFLGQRVGFRYSAIGWAGLASFAAPVIIGLIKRA
jgi:hypothetical protein